MKGTDRYFVKDVTCALDGVDMPVANLSVGGLFAATDQPPMLGQAVEFQLALPGRASFRFTGKVTWINDPERPRAAHLPRGFGIKILRIAFIDKIAILDLLKRSRLPSPRGPG